MEMGLAVLLLLLLPIVTLGSISIPDSLSLIPSQLIKIFGFGKSTFGKIPKTPKSKPISVEDILYYGKFAAIYYCDKVNEQWCNETDSMALKTITNSTFNTMGVVFLNQERKEIIISFRGTNGFQDVLLDLLFLPVTPRQLISKGDIKVHWGFWIAAMSIYESIVDEVQVLLWQHEDIERISVAGASLGGALATITSFVMNYDYPFHRKVETSLVTFGQPRVGNSHFANYMNSLPIKMGRVVFKGDPVPHLPPETKLLGDYVHHLQEVWIRNMSRTAEGVTFCSTQLYEDPECSDSLRPMFYLPDHFGYLDLMRGVDEIKK